MKFVAAYRSPFPGALAALTLAFPLASMGCSSAETNDPTKSTDAALTYYRDVKPILDAHCAGCHVEGGIAPFAITSYELAKAQSGSIKASVVSRTMPPWQAAQGCADYLYDRSLSDETIATIAQWVDEGAAEGNPSDEPPPLEVSTTTLSRIDRTLSMPTAYTPVVSPDEYRCFLIDWPENVTRYVTGFGVQPGNDSIVHHVIAFLAPPSTVAEYEALDAADPEPGYPCFGGTGGTRLSWIGAWAPGGIGSDLPAGTGIEVPVGSKVVLQLHYNTTTAKPAPDTTKILLSLEDSVERKGVVLPFANIDWVLGKTMDIPAHSTDVTHSFDLDLSQYASVYSGGVFENGKPITIHGAGLHLHTLGTQAKTSILRQGGGEECMLDIPRWDFNWQSSYDFSKTKTLNPGDQVHLECHYDNPTAMNVNWGEGTSDEMCLGIYYATQ